MKRLLADCTIEELTAVLESMGEPKFRARQIYRAVMRYKTFDEMTDLPKALREKLGERFIDRALTIRKTFVSKDGTIKFLFALADGNIIEGVLMKYKYGNTQCVSTQVGCRMGCAFCASGIGGLVRNLTGGEILTEVLAVNAFLGGTPEDRQVTNIVLMGSGEPLDNYEEPLRFLRAVTDAEGHNVSARNISLSTCGLVPEILRLSEEGISLNLTISLHNPFDEERRELMPIGKKYTVAQITAACERYFEKTGRRYIFEYVLILGKNDTRRHAEGLAALLKGKPCLVNLIRLNAVKEKHLKAVTDQNAYRFMEWLNEAGLHATVRRQIGTDIEGACGQLRRNYIGEETR